MIGISRKQYQLSNGGIYCDIHDASETDTFPVAVGLVDDSDANAASSFNVSGSSLSNRTRWLFNRTGAFRLAFEGEVTVDDGTDGFSSVQDWTSTSYGSPFTLATVAGPTLLDDILDISISGTLNIQNPGGINQLGFVKTMLNLNGTGLANLAGARCRVAAAATLATADFPFCFEGLKNVNVPGTPGNVVVALEGRIGSASVSSMVSLIGPYTVAVRIWRPNT